MAMPHCATADSEEAMAGGRAGRQAGAVCRSRPLGVECGALGNDNASSSSRRPSRGGEGSEGDEEGVAMAESLTGAICNAWGRGQHC